MKIKDKKNGWWLKEFDPIPAYVSPRLLKITRDVPFCEGELVLTPILNLGEESVIGSEMMLREERAGLVGFANLAHLLYVQEEIPAQWRMFKLVFAGCECEAHVDGARYVPVMKYIEKNDLLWNKSLYSHPGDEKPRWEFYYEAVDSEFDRFYSIVCIE